MKPRNKNIPIRKPIMLRKGRPNPGKYKTENSPRDKNRDIIAYTSHDLSSRLNATSNHSGDTALVIKGCTLRENRASMDCPYSSTLSALKMNPMRDSRPTQWDAQKDSALSSLPLTHTSKFIAGLTLYLAILFLCPEPAHSKWRRPNDIFFGTAYTLPEDKMRIGVFAPLSYGVHDRITLSIHPILALLLTPNLSLRAKLIDSRVTLSAAAAYTQSFYVDNDETAKGQTRVFGIATIPITERFIVSASGGLAQDLTGDAQFFESTLSTHYRFDQGNIAMLQGALAKTLESEDETTFRGLFMYALAFDDFKAGAGIALSQMPRSFATIPLDDKDLRAIPYIDVWWTF